MWLTVDSESDVAVYIQLYNQIVEAIAMDMIREGETLPSVRQMAEIVGINMHTVNKTYAILREEGYITLDRRGARVSLDVDKSLRNQSELRQTKKQLSGFSKATLSFESIPIFLN